MQFPSRDLTNQYISLSYQDVVQRYAPAGTASYFLDGTGNVIAYIPVSSIGQKIITEDQVISSTSASWASSSIYSILSDTASIALISNYSDTSSISVYSSYAGSSSYSETAYSSSYAKTSSYFGEGMSGFIPAWTANNKLTKSSSISLLYLIMTVTMFK